MSPAVTRKRAREEAERRRERDIAPDGQSPSASPDHKRLKSSYIDLKTRLALFPDRKPLQPLDGLAVSSDSEDEETVKEMMKISPLKLPPATPTAAGSSGSLEETFGSSSPTSVDSFGSYVERSSDKTPPRSIRLPTPYPGQEQDIPCTFAGALAALRRAREENAAEEARSKMQQFNRLPRGE